MNPIISKVYGPFVQGRAAFGLLLLRLIVGGAFMVHGFSKIQAPFGWMGPKAPVPPIFQALAAVAEFGGGAALILGFLTPLAALGIAFVMAVAFKMVALPSGQVWIASAPKQASFEMVAFYFVAAVSFFLTGPGALSVDAALFGKKRSK